MDWDEIRHRSRKWLDAQGDAKPTRQNLLLAHETGQYLGAYLEREKIADERMSFGIALAILKDGGQVCRKGWAQRGLWLVLRKPEHEALRIDIRDKHGSSDRWYPSHTDLLTCDWQQAIVEADEL